MRFRNWWTSLDFFWKTFLFLVILTTFVVALVEGLLEPLAESLLLRFSGGFQPWHEVIMWGVSIIIPSLACGLIFSRALARKMDAMAFAADTIARGNFAARIVAHDSSRDAFERLGKSFNEMAASLEKLRENERRLLADISHELRSPLSRMGIALELLPLKNDPAAREQLVARLEKEVIHMGEVVGGLLAQGKDRLLALKGEEEAVNISTLLREVTEDLAFQGRHEGKNVVSTVPDDVLIHGHAAQLRAMLVNVGINALFYTPPGKDVYLYLAVRESEVCIHVRDYGPGVPEGQLKDIFRAFYRVDDSRARATGGAGLGLALAREASVLCGGTITARNANPGLEVQMTFPSVLQGDTDQRTRRPRRVG